jgi:HPt (histidine-containing phosphotransfer) domain-containing protein
MDDTLGAAMDELWERSKPDELARVVVLEVAAGAVAEGALTEPVRRGAQDEAHRLAGALAALGVPEGAKVARELERRFRGGPSIEQADDLAALVAALRTAVEQYRR